MTMSPGGRLEFGFDFGQPRPKATAAVPDQGVLSVLILADFSGRLNRAVSEPMSTRKRRSVTIDNQANVFANLGAALELFTARAGAPKLRLVFESLEDFHPDRLLKRVEPLAALFEPLTGLRNPAKAGEAAERLQQELTEATHVSIPETAPLPPDESAPAQPTESATDTLERLLGKAGTQSTSGKKPVPGSPVEALIRQAVASSGSATPAAPAAVNGLTSAAELELSSKLRDVLHDHDFQSLEAAWRGVDFLLRRCPDEERIRFSILDVTLDELSGDIDGLRRLLRDEPPQFVLGNYIFGRSKADLEALGGLAEVCSGLGIRFLGGAHPLLAGCDGFDRHPDPDDWHKAFPLDVAEAWTALRGSVQSRSVGLALPRFLLRQPYGLGSDPIEGFAFEEIAAATDHEAFLWGNAAFACAQVLLEGAVAEARGTPTGEGGEVGELPVFRYKEEGESAMKPCAEAWLTERAASLLLRHGFIPLLSIKGQDAVRVAGFVSIAKRT